MATIFNTLADRQTFTFPTRIAIISCGVCASARTGGGALAPDAITAGQTFKIQANSGPETTITLAGGYTEFLQFRDDIKTQVDAAYGVGVIGILQEDQETLIFLDSLNQFIKISEVSSTLHSQTGLLNAERSTGLEVEELTVLANEKLTSYIGNLVGLPLDGLSNHLSIPRGANSLSFYCTTNIGVDGYGDPVLDGYSPEIYMYLAWTNGIDGYVTDGYFSELFLNSSNKYQQSAGIFPSKIMQFGNTKFALGHSAIGSRMATPAIDVPVGATGCYVFLTLAGDDTAQYPPSATISMISGTR